jgi:hypothetical protein
MPEITSKSRTDHPRLGPYSRGLHRAAIGQFIDGRSREGRFLRAYEAMLIQHVGGAPSSVAQALISRAARLALYVELMDERAIGAGGMSERDSAQYLAWSGSLTRCLRELGLKGAAQRPLSLSELIRAKAAAKRDAAA